MGVDGWGQSTILNWFFNVKFVWGEKNRAKLKDVVGRVYEHWLLGLLAAGRQAKKEE